MLSVLNEACDCFHYYYGNTISINKKEPPFVLIDCGLQPTKAVQNAVIRNFINLIQIFSLIVYTTLTKTIINNLFQTYKNRYRIGYLFYLDI